MPDGRFIEAHQPLGATDGSRRDELEYAGWAVPKKMNRVGALAPAVKGFFRPVESPPRHELQPVTRQRDQEPAV
jgi:ubiquinol-cytochrome c reductase cytochrome b subunit